MATLAETYMVYVLHVNINNVYLFHKPKPKCAFEYHIVIPYLSYLSAK